MEIAALALHEKLYSGSELKPGGSQHQGRYPIHIPAHQE
jgi:hypothetical protein